MESRFKQLEKLVQMANSFTSENAKHSKNKKKTAKILEIESKEEVQKELSDDEKAQLVFADSPIGLAKYRHLKIFSRLTHDEAIQHVKRLLGLCSLASSERASIK